jgi:CBS domain-containing protein
MPYLGSSVQAIKIKGGFMQNKVKDFMTPDPVIIPSESTLKEAAQKMEAVDCGVLPVGSWNDLEGIITDRDIVIRAVAKGKDVTMEKVNDYMTSEVFYCDEEDTLEEVAEKMSRNNVNRLVVKDGDDKPCGIITFGCILRKDNDKDEINKIIEQVAGKAA